MERLEILSIVSGEAAGGVACGPVEGPSMAEAKFRNESGETFYMSVIEIWGIVEFFKSEESLYDYHMMLTDPTEEEKEAVADCSLGGGDPEEVFENEELEDWMPAIRFMLYALEHGADDSNPNDAFTQSALGKHIDEIEVPISEIEIGYLEEKEGYWEDDLVYDDSDDDDMDDDSDEEDDDDDMDDDSDENEEREPIEMNFLKAIKCLKIEDDDMLEAIYNCIDERMDWLNDREPEYEGDVYDLWCDKSDAWSEIMDAVDSFMSDETEDRDESDWEDIVKDIEAFQEEYGGLSRLKIKY